MSSASSVTAYDDVTEDGGLKSSFPNAVEGPMPLDLLGLDIAEGVIEEVGKCASVIECIVEEAAGAGLMRRFGGGW